MSDGYLQLLDATIGYLQGLKERGVRYVNVSQREGLERGQVVRASAEMDTRGQVVRAPITALSPAAWTS